MKTPSEVAGAQHAASSPAPWHAEHAIALEEAVRARDDFLAIAAHELRSPLNGLALRLQVLEKLAEGAPAALRQEIGQVRRSVERYVRRAAVLLDVARLNAGELRPARASVDLRRLVGDVVDTHLDEARFHQCELRADVRSDACGSWDPHMAEQILSNLVNNAIKYAGGGPVEIIADTEAGYAVLEVHDRGPGIRDEDRDRIFARFERIVDGSRRSSGYGLGLWIVGSMVAAHGGSIAIESSPGQGSVFRVRLPLSGQPPTTE